MAVDLGQSISVIGHPAINPFRSEAYGKAIGFKIRILARPQRQEYVRQYADDRKRVQNLYR